MEVPSGLQHDRRLPGEPQREPRDAPRDGVRGAGDRGGRGARSVRVLRQAGRPTTELVSSRAALGPGRHGWGNGQLLSN